MNGVRGDLEFASRLPEAREYFLDTAGLTALWPGPRRVFLVTQHPPDRSVASRLDPERVYLVARFEFRWLSSNRRD